MLEKNRIANQNAETIFLTREKRTANENAYLLLHNENTIFISHVYITYISICMYGISRAHCAHLPPPPLEKGVTQPQPTIIL